ncbi:MAG: response regulator transcription factor [Chloroflexi bacterium]|nr:response regulator transcription factor [Chloroflexota bacterium]
MPIRVVVADDHALVREGTRNILERSEDIEVVGEADDGEKAVQVVCGLSPDVALIDIAMPRLNGVEVTRRIKALSPSTAVLALSAYDDDAYVFALLEAGAAGYLMKSIQGCELIRSVRAVHNGEMLLTSSVARKLVRRVIPGRSCDTRDIVNERLTDRERGVLSWAAKGLSNKEIGKALSLSPRTVQLHLGHVFSKLGVASRTEAVMVGMRRGWVHMENVA